MNKFLPVLLAAFLLTSCSGWFFQPSPYNPPTPFLPPTHTPLIVTATPTGGGASTSTPVLVTDTPVIIDTSTPFVPATETTSPTATVTVLVPVLNASLEVLGCNTSIDVLHGMGEVTNAFVTLTNTRNVDLTNIRVTLFALDEGREHPDKTVEIPSLPVAHEVTLKLTVDSTYRAETPIQIEVSAEPDLAVDELAELRLRLEEAEDILRAIRHGEVDALVVSGPEGERIFTLKGA